MGIGPFRAPAPLLFSLLGLPPDAPAAGPEVILDLSRLLSRAWLPAPTGVDRVEMAWARGLPARFGRRLRFAARHPAGGHYGRLDPAAVAAFLAETEARWDAGEAGRRLPAARRLWSLRPRAVPPPAGPRVLLKPSPEGLEDFRTTAAILRREQARLVCLVHDLIPLTHPEYATPGAHARAAARLATIDALADGVLANSHATLAEVLPRLNPRPRITAAAPLGLDPPAAVRAPGRHFVCVATIEPRKNHLLLLNLWRRFAETLPPADMPPLVLVGRRGWENQAALAMLDRCEAIRPHVRETGPLGDRAAARVVANARALLLPSFAEGFGLPVAEAAALGTPVICSDLPGLREAGGDAPLYLDPLDAPAWTRAILAPPPARPPRPAPGWGIHLDAVQAVAEAVLTP